MDEEYLEKQPDEVFMDGEDYFDASHTHRSKSAVETKSLFSHSNGDDENETKENFIQVPSYFIQVRNSVNAQGHFYTPQYVD